MAISRGQLKDIVKECLIEILAEGMGQSTATSISEVKKPAAKSMLKSSSSAPHTSAVLRQNASNVKLRSSAALSEAIRREAGGNDVMAAILADTAEKTLPAMLENDRRPGSLPQTGTVERVVASTNPEELFGEEAASKWADLAFMSAGKK